MMPLQYVAFSYWFTFVNAFSSVRIPIVIDIPAVTGVPASRLLLVPLLFLFCYFLCSCYFLAETVACTTLFPFKVWSLSFALGPEEKNVVIFFNTLYYYEKICCQLTNNIDTYSLIYTYFSFFLGGRVCSANVIVWV